jgi:hypothetical protein
MVPALSLALSLLLTSTVEIVQLVTELDPDHLTADRTMMLRTLCPSAEDVKLIRVSGVAGLP